MSPARPKATPPYGSAGDLLRETQTRFWAVRMGEPPEYDPTQETEYLVHAPLTDAEKDGTLSFTASTLDPRSEKLMPGLGRAGPEPLNRSAICSPVAKHSSRASWATVGNPS